MPSSLERRIAGILADAKQREGVITSSHIRAAFWEGSAEFIHRNGARLATLLASLDALLHSHDCDEETMEQISENISDIAAARRSE
ncbi:hypothetical protein [Streptomyces sp. NPDC058664]|uniref:hypothetical protein n=1 Tax=unclassified Streptomyces TaxID=2593676 RepID=UPI003649F774